LTPDGPLRKHYSGTLQVSFSENQAFSPKSANDLSTCFH
jgi:hypothetical protein